MHAINSRRALSALLTLAVATAITAALVLGTGNAATATDSQPEVKPQEIAAATSIAQAAIPGAVVDLAQHDVARGLTMTVKVPATEFKIPGSSMTVAQSSARGGDPTLAALASGDVAWRSRLAGAVAAAADPSIIAVNASPASDSAAKDLGEIGIGLLSSTPPLRAFGDSVPARKGLTADLPAAAASKQIDTSVAALTKVLPDGAVKSVEVERVAVDSTRYAVRLVITVQDLPSLGSHYSELLDGPTTGLAGGDQSRVDGLAVVVRDVKGSWLARWRTERTITALTLASPDIQLPAGARLKGNYTSLTGGPVAQGSLDEAVTRITSEAKTGR